MNAGDRVGKYILEERLGSGGMAEVWAARVEGPGDFVKPVALKFILPSYSNDPEYGRMFANEARLAAELQHTNLVSILDLDRVPPDASPGLAGRYFIAMERVDGRDLATVVNRAHEIRRDIAIGLAVHIVCEVLVGLRYIHERERLTRRAGLVHRDISPHNVLLSFAGEVKVSDFGIAKLDSSRTTGDGSIRGKIPYFAPELIRGERATHQTDQFAAGIVLWELLSGRMLFTGAHDAEVLDKVKTCAVPPPGRPGRPLPPGLSEVVLRMLAADRALRFPATSAALEALMPFSASGGGSIRVSELMLELFAAPSPSAPLAPVVAAQTAVVPRLAERAAVDVRGRGGGPEPGVSAGQYSPSGTKVLPGSAPIPRRWSNGAARPRRADFSEQQGRAMFQEAERRYQEEVASGAFSGSPEEWYRRYAERTGRDAYTGHPLPKDWFSVASWPRLANLGWERHLVIAWHGSYPWGEDGYWVVEDWVSDEMMVLRPEHLGRGEFRDITRFQFTRWWLDREVDPETELPGGRTPVSRKARLLVPAGARPPVTSAEWESLCRVEYEREDRETVRAMRRMELLSTPAEPGPSLWKRLRRLTTSADGE